MDFKKLLESFDTINENIKHKSTGNYSGNIHDPEEKRDEYGHRIPAPKKPSAPVGAPDKTDKFAGSTSELAGVFGSRLPADNNKHMKAFKTREHKPMKNADNKEQELEKQIRGEKGSIKEDNFFKDWMNHVEESKTFNEKEVSFKDWMKYVEESKTLNEMQPVMPLVAGGQQPTAGQTSSDPKSQQTTQQALQQQQANKSNTPSNVQQQNANKALAQLKAIPGAKFSNPGNTLKVLADPQAAMNNPSLKAAAAELGTMTAAQASDPNAQNKSIQALKTLAGDQKKGAVASMSESKKFKALTQLIESINFQDLIKNADQDVENMLAELQADVEEFKTTGHCSDLLDSFLKVHFHHVKEKQGAMQHDPLLGDVEEGSIENHTERNALNVKPSKFVSVNPNTTPTSFKTDPIQAVTDRAINAGSKGLNFLKGLGSKNTPTKTFEGKTMKDIQLENWERQLTSLLNEGITVSTSRGQEGAPDSVSINANGSDAEQLMTILKNSGMDEFGGGAEQSHQGHEEMSMHEPMGHGNSPEPSPKVAGNDGDILSLLKKMAGGGATAPGTAEVEVDYEPEVTHADIEADDKEHATAGSEMGDMMKKMSDIESGEDSEEPCDDCGHSPCDCDSHDHGSDNHKEQDGSEKSDEEDKDKIDEAKWNPTREVKQSAIEYMKSIGLHSVHDLDAEAIQYIGDENQINYEEVCKILGCKLPEELGPVDADDEIEEGEEDGGMFGRSKNDKRYLAKFDPTNVMNISDNPGMKAHKTTRKGSLRTSQEDLEFAFGPPGKDDTWVLEFNNGLIATIYPQSNSGGMDWIIGGNHPDTEDFVHMAYSAALDDDVEEGNAYGLAARNTPKGKHIKIHGHDTGEIRTEDEHAEDCMECGMTMEECECPIEESYANSNDDTAFQDLQYMIKTLSGGINGPKHSQATGNIQKVTMETKLLKDSTGLLVDFQKLSGIK